MTSIQEIARRACSAVMLSSGRGTSSVDDQVADAVASAVLKELVSRYNLKGYRTPAILSDALDPLLASVERSGEQQVEEKKEDHGGTSLTEGASVSVSVHAPELPHDEANDFVRDPQCPTCGSATIFHREIACVSKPCAKPTRPQGDFSIEHDMDCATHFCGQCGMDIEGECLCEEPRRQICDCEYQMKLGQEWVTRVTNSDDPDVSVIGVGCASVTAGEASASLPSEAQESDSQSSTSSSSDRPDPGSTEER